MKNILQEVKTLVSSGGTEIKVGVITSKNRDGGYTVLNSKGVSETITGSASVGETVLYKDGQIINRIQGETATRYYIK